MRAEQGLLFVWLLVVVIERIFGVSDAIDVHEKVRGRIDVAGDHCHYFVVPLFSVRVYAASTVTF